MSSSKMVWLHREDLCSVEVANTNRCKVQMIIGLASYYRQYLMKLAEFCHSTSPHKKSVEFNSKENCECSFQVLKNTLTQAFYSSDKKGFNLQTDTSAVGKGAVLEQKGCTVSLNGNVWLLSLLSNTSGITCLADHSFYALTIRHFILRCFVLCTCNIISTKKDMLCHAESPQNLLHRRL